GVIRTDARGGRAGGGPPGRDLPRRPGRADTTGGATVVARCPTPLRIVRFVPLGVCHLGGDGAGGSLGLLAGEGDAGRCPARTWRTASAPACGKARSRGWAVSRSASAVMMGAWSSIAAA